MPASNALGRTGAAGRRLSLCARPPAELSDQVRTWRTSRAVDGYAGFEPLTNKGDIVLTACWSHTRRRFYELAHATNAPIATEAFRRIAALYAIEAELHGQSPAHRLAARHNRSKLIVEKMRLWFEAQLPLVPGRSTLAEAIRYALSRCEDLTRFLHDGRIELDTAVPLTQRHEPSREALAAFACAPS